MKDYIILKNVRDIRDGKEYSEAIVSRKKAKWFVPIEDNEAPEEE